MQEAISRLVITFIFITISQNTVIAQPQQQAPASSEQAIIDGVTNFLAERAQANAAYIYTSKLKKDRALQCYLPNTFETLQNSDLVMLLKANSKILRNYIKEDLRFAAIILLLTQNDFSENIRLIESFKINRWNGKDIPDWLAYLVRRNENFEQNLPLLIDDIDAIILTIDKVKKTINITDKKLSVIKEQINKKNEPRPAIQALGTVEEIESRLQTSSREEYPCWYGEFKGAKSASEKLREISSALGVFVAQLAMLKQNLILLNNMLQEQLQTDLTKADAAISKSFLLNKVLKDIDKNFAKTITNKSSELANTNPKVLRELAGFYAPTKDKSYSSTALELINTISAICKESQYRNTTFCGLHGSDEDINPQDKLKEVKTNILFFASLADAKTADDVTTILQNFMLPPVSFGEIREATHWTISSYVGIDYTTTSRQLLGANNPATTNTAGWGIYAPIGLQRSFPCNGTFHLMSPKSWSSFCPDGGSLAFMLSPFDFGYPLSLKLNGSNNGTTWNDVVNPSIAIAYGKKNSPVNWGIAWQRVRSSLNNPNPGSRVLFFISLDMPLYIIQ